MNPKIRNSSNTLMVLQQQYNHQKRLSQIYNKQPTISNTITYTNSTLNRKSKKRQKLNEYVQQQHLRNIKKLVESITQQKSILQRQKDKNDFYAYPALFFRQVSIPLKRIKSAKYCRPFKNNIRQNSQSTPKLTIQRIKQFLPNLQSFQQNDLQEWLDGVNKLIITFNIMQKDDIVDLCQKIISLLPKKCPQQFREAVQEQLHEIRNGV